jgi:hypothetical protein
MKRKRKTASITTALRLVLSQKIIVPNDKVTSSCEENAAINSQVFESGPVFETRTRQHPLPHEILAGTFENGGYSLRAAQFSFIHNVWMVHRRELKQM